MAEIVTHVVMEMDEEYLAWVHKKRKAKDERENPKQTETVNG